MSLKNQTLTKENYQAILPKLQLAPAAIADIKSAAEAGFTVTTHEKRITLNGYTGEGYIILNEQGVGAYMINGGMYGGIMMIVGLLIASVGGFLDGYHSGMGASPLERMKKILYKKLGKTRVGIAWLGVLITAVNAVADDSLATADIMAQISLALLSAWMSGVFTASLAGIMSLASPWVIAILGMLASAIFAIALTVVAQEYFSDLRLKRMRRYA